MARSLYSKFILGYLIFGLLSVLTIATFSSGITRDYLVKDRANALYDEANDIAASCSLMYQGQHQDMDLFSTQLKNVSTYLRTEIWVVNKSGVVIMDSKNGSRVHTTIPDFDPTATGNRSYTIGTYYKLFDQNVLSVSAPVTGNYTTYGYVLIHLPVSEIADSQSHILDILYMTCAIIFGLSLIILVVFTITVYLPLRKIAAGANEYAAGNLNYRIKVNAHDEMGYLSNTLNYMSDELNKMEEYQRNFIANVSHELKTPMTSMKVLADSLLEQENLPVEMYREFMEDIAKEIDRENQIITDLLSLVKMNRTGQTMNIQQVNINDLLEQILKRLKPIAEKKNVEMVMESFRPVSAEIDETKFTLAVSNLVENAIKYNHENGWVHVSLNADHKYFYLKVEDSGLGIPQEDQAHIFERFYRVDKSHSREIGGTGLGLAIARNAVIVHRGSIKVHSNEGEGTTFTVRIPLIYTTVPEGVGR